MTEGSAIIEQAYSDLAIEKLKRLIAEYERPSTSLTERTRLLEAIALHKSQDGRYLSRIPTAQRSYARNTNFFRIRTDCGIWGELKIQDFWENPKGGKKGRLNQQGESLLYAAANPETAMMEVRSTPQNRSDCLLIIYKSNNDLNVTEIGLEGAVDRSLYGNVYESAQLIDSFVGDCIRREGNEDFVYDLTNLLAKKYMHFSEDGWCYGSVQNPGGTNFCFPLATKKKLDLIVAMLSDTQGVHTFYCHFDGEKFELHTDCEIEGSSGRKKFHEINLRLRIQPTIDDLQPHNRSTSPTIVTKVMPSNC